MKVLLTGSNGTIGSVLRRGLVHDITPFDMPQHDARNYDDVAAAAEGHDAIVHLAWDTLTDNYRTDHMNPDNLVMTDNIYRAAAHAGVGRVVMASSVNADRFTNRSINGLLSPYDLPLPNSPYGAGKVHMEAMGRYYADAKGLGVVCIRFGNVNRADQPKDQGPGLERQVFLSHRDCVNLVDAALTAPELPADYQIVYGVSDNVGRVHDVANDIGWQPIDGAR